MIEFVLLMVGLVGLWFGSNLTIRGAKNVAGHFRISTGFLGVTVLSIGTSIPEIAVSIAGGIDHKLGMETSGLVVGEVIGSAANQLTIILGLVGLFGYLYIRKRNLWREGGMLIGSILLLGIFALDGRFTVFEGGVMILTYLMYLYFVFHDEKVVENAKGSRPTLHAFYDTLMMVGGILLVVYSAQRVVESGVALASTWGVSQAFIGIFIIGLGTGLPELAVSFTALRQKEVAMSVSNLIGSNICDLLVSLGAGTVISGFLVPRNVLWFDIPFLLVIAGVVIAMFRNDMRLKKPEALGLIVLYFVYLGTRLWLFG